MFDKIWKIKYLYCHATMINRLSVTRPSLPAYSAVCPARLVHCKQSMAGQRCKKRLTLSVLIFSSCSNFLGLHTICCTILRIFEQFCGFFFKILQIFANIYTFLQVFADFLPSFLVQFFKLKVVSVPFHIFFATLVVIQSELGAMTPSSSRVGM